MRNLKLVIEYDGGKFSGFQAQPDEITVQGELERSLHRLTGERVRLTGAGRTDSGVHALSQTVNFKTNSRLSVIDIKRALNSVLRHIVVNDVKVVSASFDSRKSAKEREYVYLVYCGEVMPVLLSGRACHVRGKLNIGRMRKASAALLGKHDFSSFCAKDRIRKDCRKALKRIQIGIKPIRFFGHTYRMVYFRFIAGGFLWKMVRFMVGTLIKVGLGKIGPAAVKKIIAAKDNRMAGPVAPAHGLYLTRISY